MAIDTPAAPHLVVTDGAHRHEVVRPWQHRGPSGDDVGAISQLAVDRHGRVFVLQRSAPLLRVYAADGALLFTHDHPRLTSGHGLHVDTRDRLWVTTYDAHQVLVFDARPGTPGLPLLFELGDFNAPNWQAPFNHPTGVHSAPNGDIYVSDGYGNARIHRFDTDGRHLQSWGEPGRGPGQFNTPHAVWVLPDGRVLCADRDNDRIQVFDPRGALLAIWDGLVRPMALWAPADGSVLYVTEQVPRVARLDPRDGHVLGRARAFGLYAHGLAGDHHGNLYIAEQGTTSLVAQYRRLPT